jgi:hypothetical protein
MTAFPLTSINAGPVPAKVNLPAAAGQTFVTLQLAGITNAAHYGKAGYAIPFNSTSNPGGGSPLMAYAVGMNLGATPGTNQAFTQGGSPSNIYQPLMTPGTPNSSDDGCFSVNLQQGAFKLLASTATPSNYAVCSTATTGSILYSNDGQSVLTFDTQAHAIAVGYVIVGIQLSFNDDGDGQVEVLCESWLNAILSAVTA